ncbi:MAG: hypothetical protein AAFO03_04810 [Bacteroidota bacterium]
MNKGHFYLNMQLDIWSMLILLFLAQGLYLLGTLILSTHERKYYWNRFLAGILLSVLWWLMEFLSIRNVLEIPLNIFYGTRYGSWLLLALLFVAIFLYLLSQSDIYRRAMDYLYVLPLSLFVYAASYKLAGVQ